MSNLLAAGNSTHEGETSQLPIPIKSNNENRRRLSFSLHWSSADFALIAGVLRPMREVVGRIAAEQEADNARSLARVRPSSCAHRGWTAQK